MADHEVEFNLLMEEYIIPADVFDINAWTTADLVKLSNLIDAELQARYDAEEAAKELWEGLPDSPTVHTAYGL
jgi:hypothetical protein